MDCSDVDSQWTEADFMPGLSMNDFISVSFRLINEGTKSVDHFQPLGPTDFPADHWSFVTSKPKTCILTLYVDGLALKIKSLVDQKMVFRTISI